MAPGWSEAWITEVELLLAAGRGGEIRGVLDQAAAALPGEQGTLTLAVCHAMAGNDTDAARFFQAALDRKPADPTTIRLAAAFHIKLARFDLAEPLIARLIDPATQATPADVAWAARTRAWA